MPRNVYFWQGGSLPLVGQFPAGVIVTLDDDDRTVLSTTPLAIAPAPTVESADASPPQPPTGQASPLSPQDAPSPTGDAPSFPLVNGG